MAHTQSASCDWKCRSGLLIWWWHARPLERRCHLQSHREWHLQMTVWHLDPVHLKNKSDSFIGPLKLLFPFSILRMVMGLLLVFPPFISLLRSRQLCQGRLSGHYGLYSYWPRLSHYLTFPLTWSPAVFQLRVVFWQRRLSAGALEWHFALSPLWTCALTISLLFYFSFVGGILSWKRLLACVFSHYTSW